MIWLTGLAVAGIVGWAIIGCIAWGQLLLKVMAGDLPGSGRFPRLAWAAGSGLAAWSTCLLWLALAGWLNRATTGALWLLVLGAGACRAFWQLRNRTGLTRRMRFFLPVGSGLFLLAFPFLILPPTAWDAMVYHLEVPRQYLLHGGMTELPRNLYSYFPQAMEMLYASCLAWLPACSTQFLHFAFLLLILLGVTELLPARLASRQFVLLLVTAATLPSCWLDAVTPYLDVAWAFYTFLLVSGVLLFIKRREAGWLGPVFALAGFYPALKYPCLHLLVVLGLATGLLLVLRREAATLPWRRLLITAGTAFLLSAAPYFARNWCWTGDPVFPLLTALFPTRHPVWTAELERAYWGFLHLYGDWMTLPWLQPFHFIFAPFAARMEIKAFYDGFLGPWLAIPWLFLRVWRRMSDGVRFLTAWVLLYGLLWGLTMRQIRFLLPAVPVILLLLLFSGRLRLVLPEVKRRRYVLVLFATIQLALNAWIAGGQLLTRPVLDYWAGRTNETEYLAATLPAYSCQQFINRNLPAQAKVWVLLTGNENFYLERSYLADYIIEDSTFQTFLRTGPPDQIAARFREYGITHLLIRLDVYFRPEMYLDRPGLLPVAKQFLATRTRMLYRHGDYGVFEWASTAGEPSGNP